MFNQICMLNLCLSVFTCGGAFLHGADRRHSRQTRVPTYRPTGYRLVVLTRSFFISHFSLEEFERRDPEALRRRERISTWLLKCLLCVSVPSRLGAHSGPCRSKHHSIFCTSCLSHRDMVRCGRCVVFHTLRWDSSVLPQ